MYAFLFIREIRNTFAECAQTEDTAPCCLRWLFCTPPLCYSAPYHTQAWDRSFLAWFLFFWVCFICHLLKYCNQFYLTLHGDRILFQ